MPRRRQHGLYNDLGYVTWSDNEAVSSALRVPTPREGPDSRSLASGLASQRTSASDDQGHGARSLASSSLVREPSTFLHIGIGAARETCLGGPALSLRRILGAAAAGAAVP